MLQKPSRNSKITDHIACIVRCLPLWLEGQLDVLVAEGNTLQGRLKNLPPNRRMVRDAVSCPGGEKSVRDILRDKHPPAQPINHDALLKDDTPAVHPVVFDSIDKGLVRSAALKTSGAAGPSGLDAYCWRHLCTCFGRASSDLCQALADVAKRLCTTFIDPEYIVPFTACRLIALNKNPGVRPIGIGDTARRIIAKSVLMVIRGDIQDAAGTLQLCAGQISGIEAAVHAVRSAFEDDNTEAVLLVDASNAFNSLNRKTALHNIRSLCPTLSTILINTYRSDPVCFVDGDTLHSRERTTQGDPLAMPMYAIATMPLIQALQRGVKQVWYADDASATGGGLPSFAIGGGLCVTLALALGTTQTLPRLN